MNALEFAGADYIRVICFRCDDYRVVQVGHESAPCPACGTDEQRRALFRERAVMPAISTDSLDETEKDLVREWRARGFHELDCLRWIEGRRYDPLKDAEWLKEARAHWKAWHTAWKASAV
jgi:hypothetical protein